MDILDIFPKEILEIILSYADIETLSYIVKEYNLKYILNWINILKYYSGKYVNIDINYNRYIKYISIEKLKKELMIVEATIIIMGITALNLKQKGLFNLPKEIAVLDNLNVLILNSNHLIKFPKEICELHNLETLYFHNNNLSKLPKEICNLKKLTSLGLSQNDLIKLPKEIGNLKNLKCLYLYRNKLIELPQEIGNLINLEILGLSNNLLIKISKEIFNLRNLMVLHMDNNKLKDIESVYCICELINLKELLIHDNLFTEAKKSEIRDLTINMNIRTIKI